MFLADLVREMRLDLRLSFVTVSSYATEMLPTGVPIIREPSVLDVLGADVLVVEDILDTGHSMRALIDHLQARGPHSVRSCVLIDKHERRAVDVAADYVGFELREGFVVGYGIVLCRAIPLSSGDFHDRSFGSATALALATPACFCGLACRGYPLQGGHRVCGETLSSLRESTTCRAKLIAHPARRAGRPCPQGTRKRVFVAPRLTDSPAVSTGLTVAWTNLNSPWLSEQPMSAPYTFWEETLPNGDSVKVIISPWADEVGVIVHRNGVLDSLESVPTVALAEQRARQLHEQVRALLDEADRDG